MEHQTRYIDLDGTLFSNLNPATTLLKHTIHKKQKSRPHKNIKINLPLPYSRFCYSIDNSCEIYSSSLRGFPTVNTWASGSSGH